LDRDIKYKVIVAISQEGIATLVNDSIENGWLPLNGVSIAGDFRGVIVYAQAMTK